MSEWHFSIAWGVFVGVLMLLTLIVPQQYIDRVMNALVERGIGTPPFLVGWVGICVEWFATKGFGLDPSPFFLMNIFMSVWATLTLPILTMAARWSSEKQRLQLDYMRELAEGQRDMIFALRAQISDIDADVDAIREARELESGE